MSDRGGLCGPCWRETPFILGAVCTLCGVPVMAVDDEGAHCNDCRAIGRAWQWGRAAMLYTGGARRLVLGLKHGDRLDLVPPMAGWMAARLEPLLARDALLVPVPSHRWRLFRRRYNQAALLANAIAHRSGTDVCPDMLDRVRATQPQKGIDVAARIANLEGAIQIAARRAEAARGRQIVLIDDVMTSGATLGACAGVCLAAGAREVGVLVLARAARDDYITGETK